MKRSHHAPRAGKSEEEKKENRAERGMGEWKEAIMPRRQGKTVRRGEKPGLTGRKRRKITEKGKKNPTDMKYMIHWFCLLTK